MKQTVRFGTFQQAFEALRPDNFSYEGLTILFDYLEQWEADSGEDLELDVIAICCDFSEDTVEDIAHYYSIDLDGCEDDSERFETVKAHLEDECAFLGETDEGRSIVYRSF
jgi:hypothetical protein